MRCRFFLLLMIILLPLASVAQEVWTAKWIGLDTSTAINQWNCYRKTVTLPRKRSHMTARISTDSKYWLYINGVLVIREGQLKRGPNPEDTYYDEVDISRFLKTGKNDIAVLTWFWGKHGFAHKSSGRTALLFQCDDESLNSDASWKVRRHPAYYNPGGIQPNYRLAETNVGFDAAKEDNWITEDISTWKSAVEFGAPPVAPWNKLVKRDIPFWKESELKDYVEKPVKKGDTLICRLPYDAQVTPYLKITATAGKKIQLITDNYLTAGSIDLASVRTEYTTRSGEQAFETPAWMNGHFVQYVIPEGVTVQELKYRESGYATELTGSFFCSDPALNTLWQKAQRTLYVNMRDNYFDCPDRERALWWGDVATEIGETYYSMDTAVNQITRKAIRNLVDWQAPDSSLYSPVPGNWTQELPQQMLAAIHGMYTYYTYTGDTAMMQYVYPAIKKYMSLWKTDERGMIMHRKGGWDLPDWGQNIDAVVLDNAWYIVAAKALASMAELSGDKTYAAALKKQINRIGEATHKYCWQDTAYRAPGYNGQTDDRANAMTVIAGIAQPNQYPAIIKVLDHARHASPYMEKYVLESLFVMHAPEAALKRMKERYGAMVDNPLTTLNELFGDNKGGTNNHAWSGGPLTLLSQYTSGVMPLLPGYKKYLVMPQPASLKYVSSTHETVKGKISMKYTVTPGGENLQVNVLPGTTVFVALRASPGGTVLMNNKQVWISGGFVPAEGVSWVGNDNGYTLFSISEKGIYNFVSM